MNQAGVALAGGGTGGHLVPGLILAQAIAAAGGRPFLITGDRPVEDQVLAASPWERIQVRLPGRAWALPAALLPATARMIGVLRRRRARAVVVLGGRVALPAALAGALTGRPLLLLEINAVPGRTVRWLAPLARRIYVGLAQTARALPARTTMLSGIPVRPEFLAPPPREAAAAALGLPSGTGPVLLLFGGSMGAESLNRIALQALARPGVLPAGTRVVHIAGTAMAEEARAAWSAAGIPAVVRAFLPEMILAYALADLVLCRGGAMTVAEVGAVGAPAVIVPYPWHKDRHQELNARALGQGARILRQSEAPEALAPLVAGLLSRPAERAAMAEAAARALPPFQPARLLEDLGRSLGPP